MLKKINLLSHNPRCDYLYKIISNETFDSLNMATLIVRINVFVVQTTEVNSINYEIATATTMKYFAML